MAAPDNFSWIDKPLLAGSARPRALDEFQWLRKQGVQLVVTLTEDPPARTFINEAGLFALHVPIEDMHAPSQPQIDTCLSALRKARQQNMGAVIHCTAGLGRTGTLLACWFVLEGMNAKDAVARIRRLRPGSIETDEQVDAIAEYARRRKSQQELDVP